MAAAIEIERETSDYQWIQQDCPICEIPPSRVMGKRGGRAHRQGLGVMSEVSRCGKCRLIFPNPMPVPKGGYAQHYGMEASVYFEHHTVESKRQSALTMLEQAENLLGRTGKILDIGTGRGDLLYVAQQTGWKATGIEVSPTFAEQASRESGVTVHREPVEQCGFPPASFDAVILAAVLEHLYNPDQTIKEIARVLRPGGVLFLDVPNEDGLYFRIGNLYLRMLGRDWVMNLSPTFSPYHLFGFNPKSLRTLLSKYDLEPKLWNCYAGRSWVPAGRGLSGLLEKTAARVVTALSEVGEFGTYIDVWAVKR